MKKSENFKFSPFHVLLILVAVFAGMFGARLSQPDDTSVFPMEAYFISYPGDDEQGRLLGIGEYVDANWVEYLTVKRQSRLKPEVGHPALVINNIKEPNKTFELGFYDYGPTLVTNNEIVEFWIGDSRAGAQYSALSVRSLFAPFGGQLQIRNHADTSAVMIVNHHPNDQDYHVMMTPMDNVTAKNGKSLEGLVIESNTKSKKVAGGGR